MTSKVTSEVPGNTNTGTSKTPKLKSRKFLLTLNEPEKYNNLKEYLTNISSFKYLISSKEKAPTTGHEHIHIFFYSSNPIKLSLKKTQGANIVLCNGTPQEIKNYVIKDGEIIDELGTEPHQGKKNFNYEEINQMTTQDILNNEDLNLIQKKTILNIKKDISNQPVKLSNYRKNVKVYYICGPSGSGKTNKALDIIQENNFDEFDEVKYSNGFYIGASGLSKACLYDEFRASHMSISEFINFIDYNKHNMNIKGGFIKNNYELIIITSIQDPNNIYNNVIDNEETREQILRRINIINLN